MLSRLHIKAKVLAGVLVGSVFSVVIGTVATLDLRAARDDARRIYERSTVPLTRVIAIANGFQQARVINREFLLAGTPEELRSLREKHKETLAGIAKNAQEYKAALSEAEQREFASYESEQAKLFPVIDPFVDLLLAGKREEGLSFLKQSVAPLAASMQSEIDKLTQRELARARALQESIGDRVEGASIQVVVITVLGLALGVAFGWFIAGGIARPLQKATEAASSGDLSTRLRLETEDEIGEMSRAFDAMAERLERKAQEAAGIAQGDLTIEIATAGEGDQLGQAFKKMAARLQNLVRQVRDASAEVSAGAQEISAASQALSQGATEQASSLEEIGSSITEIGSQAKANAENAGQANQLVASARGAAEKGDQQMKSMVQAMEEITSSSQRIAKIIKVIDDIAFQTNLLALNAAVEAARAGKHGKGFAVVAEEVRNLAGRSAKAARETAEMIESATKSVENGLAVAQATSESFDKIVGDVVKTADLIGEMSAASNEQAQGIAQISEGLSQIDQVTQRNTASAEQTASAAGQLSSSAGRVRELLGRFRIDGAQEPPAGPSAPRPARKPAQAAPHKDGWGSPAAGANGHPKPALGARPSDAIALDDKEFGRY